MVDIFEFFKNRRDCQLLIVSDEKEALKVSHAARYFNLEPFVLGDIRANFGDDLLSFSDELNQTVKTLELYYKYPKQNKLLISPLRTITFPLPKKSCFDSFSIEFGDKINLEEFKSKLYNWGYYFVDIVTSNAEVSIRGDIIDIFPLNLENGYRISLFDDEVESIREFNVETQKSLKDELESITVYPAFLALKEEQLSKINIKIEESNSDAFIKNIHSLGFWYLEDLGAYYTGILNSYISESALKEIEECYIFDDGRISIEELKSLKLIPKGNEFNEVAPQDYKEFLGFHRDKKITIISSSEAKLKALELDLKGIKVLKDDLIINLVSKDELIISLNKEVKKKRKKRVRIVLDELTPGELVVHETHGIGKFKQIEPVTVMGAKRDFVVIEYAGEDKLLIPMENLDTIDRYVADSGMVAVVDKLGKGSFVKLKAKVKEKLFAIAEDIIKLAAKREVTPGIKINGGIEEIALFQNSAGFEYTKDQVKSVKEVFKDLSSGLVMDRLLSGDVGFGKTEVAMNSILAAVLSGYQALLIAPTTLLSFQHFVSLKERFGKFDISVAKLDGKTSTKDKNAIKNALEDGRVQVVVGTHSLLGVTCKDLALVVVDEEHKFGVKQKEKLKELRSNVHLLSMSATPIPRTLNLALSKIKGMSQLFTPPKERIGTRSFVKEYSDNLIKEIILREKRRGGQIFYIYNNIASIEMKKNELLEILPNLKIGVLHSKVTPSQSEKTMESFSGGGFDILLATSIVESGLHLPNANSIIIDGADRFGIADLHQLRGRVGRGSKEGFCYFIVEDKNKITNDAVKRLIALESNSYLGSGAALAYQDLEIRGGGNIIGEAQSGHIKQIGYSLYLKMLEDTLSKLSGEDNQQSEHKSVDIKLAVSAYISDEYVKEDRVRLELYRRLSKAKSKEEVYEIQDEMEDRFGKLDLNSSNFIELIIIKIMSINKDIKMISSYGQNITFVHENGNKETIKAASKDDDDILISTKKFLN
jgi:transcription-repair coupling factor (superfamily II helicase)